MTVLATQPLATPAATTDVAGMVAHARIAGAAWADASPRHRVSIFRHLRHALVDRSNDIASTLSDITHRPLADSLAAELLPVLDSIRFIERRLVRLLRPQRLG